MEFFFFHLQPIDKQSLLDSGILCCLIHILNALLDPDEVIRRRKATDDEEPLQSEKGYNDDASQVRRLEVAFCPWAYTHTYMDAYVSAMM